MPQQVVVLYDYQDPGQGLLALRKGEHVTLLKDAGNGWAEGETEDGRHGFFPMSFVSREGVAASASEPVVEEKKEEPAAEPAKEEPVVEEAKVEVEEEAKEKGDKSEKSEKSEKGEKGDRKDSMKKSKKKSSAKLKIKKEDEGEKEKEKEKKKKSSKSKSSGSKSKSSKSKSSSSRPDVVSGIARRERRLDLVEQSQSASVSAWALEMLTATSDSSPEDLLSALDVSLEHGEELDAYLTHAVAAWNTVLEVQQKGSIEEEEKKKLRKIASKDEVLTEAFDQSLFEDQEKQTELYAMRKKALMEVLTRLRDETVAVRQSTFFGVGDSEQLLQDAITSFSEAFPHTPSVSTLNALEHEIEACIAELSGEALIISRRSLQLEEMADDGVSVGAFRQVVCSSLSRIFAASILLAEKGYGGGADAAGFDGPTDFTSVENNALMRKQVLALMEKRVPIGGRQCVPMCSFLAKMATRSDAGSGTIASPEALASVIAQELTYTYRRHITDLSLVGAVQLASAAVLRMLGCVLAGRVNLIREVTPQLFVGLSSLTSEGDRARITCGDAAVGCVLLGSELISLKEWESAMATLSGGEIETPEKHTKFTESELFEFCPWRVRTAGAHEEFTHPGKKHNNLAIGTRDATSSMRDELVVAGWHMRLISATDAPAAGGGAGDGAKVAELQATISSLEEQVSAAAAAAEAAAARVAAIETQLQKLEEQAGASEAKAQATHAELQRGLAALQESVQGLSARAADTPAPAAASPEALDAVSGEVAALQKRVAEQEEAAVEDRKKIVKMFRMVQALGSSKSGAASPRRAEPAAEAKTVREVMETPPLVEEVEEANGAEEVAPAASEPKVETVPDAGEPVVRDVREVVVEQRTAPQEAPAQVVESVKAQVAEVGFIPDSDEELQDLDSDLEFEDDAEATAKPTPAVAEKVVVEHVAVEEEDEDEESATDTEEFVEEDY